MDTVDYPSDLAAENRRETCAHKDADARRGAFLILFTINCGLLS